MDDQSFFEESFFWADSSMFDVFTVSLVRGSPKTALAAPYSLVLTEETARKYFGEQDPMGRVLTVDDMDLTVRGVARSWPEQSHFSFDFLGSFSTLEAEQGSPSANWNWWALGYYTYFRLAAGSDVATVGEAVREMPSRYIGEQESRSGYRQFLYLQPIEEIHLTSHYRSELEANSRES
ncbi:MAG TPA: ABC transporter permease [Rhodothermales bacterium]|nr:ABC transporter permease [Rhodothermales bacterium]